MWPICRSTSASLSVSVSTFMYVPISGSIRKYEYPYIRIHMHVYINLYTYIYICIHTYMCMLACTHMFDIHIYVYIHFTYVYTYAHLCIHRYPCTGFYAFVYSIIYLFMNIQIYECTMYKQGHLTSGFINDSQNCWRWCGRGTQNYAKKTRDIGGTAMIIISPPLPKRKNCALWENRMAEGDGSGDPAIGLC